MSWRTNKAHDDGYEFDDTNTSKYLKSDKGRLTDWEKELKARRAYEDEDRMIQNKLEPEELKRQQEKNKRMQKLIQTDPEFRKAYFNRLHRGQTEYQADTDQANAEEAERLQSIWHQEDQEKRQSNPWSILTDKLLDGVRTLPGVGEIASEVGHVAKDYLEEGGKLAIQHVQIKADIPYKQALKMARNILHTKKRFKEKIIGEHYHFRNIPKSHIKPRSFRGKKINEDVTLIFGEPY